MTQQENAAHIYGLHKNSVIALRAKPAYKGVLLPTMVHTVRT